MQLKKDFTKVYKEKQPFADVIENSDVILKKFAIFTGKYFCCSLLLIKLQARAAILLKSESNTGVFL